MIECVRIENFKSIKSASVALSNLNIVAGSNGSGKSTLLQAILLLKQIDADRKNKVVHLNGPFVQLGDVQAVHHKWASSENLTIDYSFSEEESLSVRKQVSTSSDAETLPLKNTSRRQVSFDSIRYLSANRIAPSDIFLYSSDRNGRRDVGINGEFSVAYLSQNLKKPIAIQALDHPNSGAFGIRGTLEANVNSWMQSISPGVSIDAAKLDGMNASKLTYGYESKDSLTGLSSFNVGFGITYVLPVITLVLSAKPGDILIIENPEAHVHPKGQVQLGKFLALASTLGLQIVVETHSDHIFNGMRLFIKEHHLRSGCYAFYYVERKVNDGGGFGSIFSRVQLFRDAKIKNAPVGFFDDWENTIFSLL